MCIREERAALLDGQKRKSDAVLAIIVAPSQELAIQIVREARGGHPADTASQAPPACAAARSASPFPRPEPPTGLIPPVSLFLSQTERILGEAAQKYVQQAIGGANINRQARRAPPFLPKPAFS